jgi:hypothetical protein
VFIPEGERCPAHDESANHNKLSLTGKRNLLSKAAIRRRENANMTRFSLRAGDVVSYVEEEFSLAFLGTGLRKGKKIDEVCRKEKKVNVQHHRCRESVGWEDTILFEEVKPSE